MTPTRSTHTDASSSHHDGYGGYYEVWFDNIIVDCWPAEYPTYEWYLSVNIDTSYGPGLIVGAIVSLTTSGNPQYWDDLDPYGYSEWSTSVVVTYLDCYESYDIVFTAYEEDGTSHGVNVLW